MLDAAGARGDQRRELLDAAHRRDRVAWARLLDDAAFEPAIDAALRMPTHMRGGVEVLEACHAMLAPCGCVGALEALDELAATMELLEAAGVAGRVKADLGVIRDFDYYTGLVVEAYAPGLGVPLGGGGRYDAVLAAFDAPAPAAGFAIGVERLHIALADQGRLPSVAPLDAVVGGTDATSVFAAAARLRAQGWRVTQCCNGSRTEVVASAAERGAACALWAQAGSLGTLGPDGAVSGALDLADLPEPPSGALAGTLGAVR